MKKLKENKGLTLLEVIISLAIFGILIAGFIRFFGDSFVSMVSYGNKSKAVLEASEVMEKSYSGEIALDKADDLEGMGGEHVENPLSSELYRKTEEQKFNFYIEDVNLDIDGNTVEGKNLNVIWFYEDGNRYVRLSSFIPN